MALASIKDVPEGTLISFRTKNAADVVVWQGTLELIGTYRAIRSYFDPSSYNQAVRQTDPSVPTDITLLTYFVITVDNQSSTPTMMPFADEWIQPGSLVNISLGTQVSLVVDDPLNNPQAIISLLASAGYGAKITS